MFVTVRIKQVDYLYPTLKIPLSNETSCKSHTTPFSKMEANYAFA